MSILKYRRPSRSRLERLAVAAFRSGFAALDRVNRDISAACAEALFRTPPPSRLTPRERGLLASGAAGFSPSPVGRLATWRWGEGPGVLLVHGWGGHAGRLTEFVRPVVSLGYSVVAFDAPGHGSSGRRGTVFELLDAIRALDDQYGPFSGVIGHSLGASAAVLAIRRGTGFERAILLAPPADLEAYLARFARRFGISARTRELLRRRLERRYAIRWERLRLASFPGPPPKTALLVIHDARDSRVPCREGASIARTWPGARLVRTQGLGHHRILRDRGVIRKAVEFLRRAAGSRVEARAI